MRVCYLVLLRVFCCKAIIWKKLFLLTEIILITGCATIPPINHEFKSRETYQVPNSLIWEPVSSFLVNNVAPIEVTDKESGKLITGTFKVPYEGFQYYSKYTDCGELAGLLVFREILGEFEISISESAIDTTVVEISPHYRAALWFANSFKGWVPCQSRGYVEKMLFDELNLKLENYKKTAAKKSNEEKTECSQILPSFRDDAFKKLLRGTTSLT